MFAAFGCASQVSLETQETSSPELHWKVLDAGRLTVRICESRRDRDAPPHQDLEATRVCRIHRRFELRARDVRVRFERRGFAFGPVLYGCSHILRTVQCGHL